MKKHFVFHAVLLLSILTQFTYAQDISSDNPTQLDYNIQSPTAATFTKFGNIPVNYYSGLPTIKVPIYTATLGQHKLPISISYHASGIKSEDLSSDVGLNWALEADFLITRILRGKPDENGYVGSNDSSMIVSNQSNLSNPVTFDTFKASAINIKDGQPDEFYFNIGENVGKFVLSPHTKRFLTDQDITVDYSYTINGFAFVITDAKGVKYFFNDASLSNTTGCGDDPGSLEYISSWHISKIIYPDTKDSLVFNYTTEYITVRHKSESKIYDHSNTYVFPVKTRNCESYSNIFEKKLSSIVTPKETISFDYTQPKLEISNSNALTKIEILDNNNTSYQKVRFAYSYYDNDYYAPSSPKRLKLDSLWMEGSDGVISQKYKFGYNGNSCIPFQGKGQDIWGYYNGVSNNTSLIPGNTYQLTNNLTGIDFFVPGGNREVDTDFVDKGVLNSVTYPAGGMTMFDYEVNRYGHSDGNNINDPILVHNTATVSSNCTAASSNPLNQVHSVDFSINKTQVVDILTTGNPFNCTGDTRHVSLIDLYNNQEKASSDGESIADVPLIFGHNYRLTVSANCENAEQNMLTCNEYLTAKINYITVTSAISKVRYGGGLRIKKITDYDPYSNISNVKSYSYAMPNEPDRSSGTIMFLPVFNFTVRYMWDWNAQNAGGGYYVPQYEEVNSDCFSSEVNNTAQNSETIGYQYVKETIGQQGQGGSSLYTFSIGDQNLNLETYPYVPATSYKHRNGQLINIQVSDVSNNLVKQIINHYTYVPNDSIPGWKANYARYMTTTFGNPPSWEFFNASHYKYISEKVRLDTSITIEYNNGDALTTTSWFDYTGPNSYYPYKSSTLNSDGIVNSNVFWRSCDYGVTSTLALSGMPAALKYMTQNHLNDYPVESYSLTNGLVADGKMMEYMLKDLGTMKEILPAVNYRLDIAVPVNNYTATNHTVTNTSGPLGKDSRYFAETSFLTYNEKGNPLAMVGPGNEAIALIWGYKNLRPVAKIHNIDLVALNNYLGANPSLQSILTNPTSDNTVRNIIQQIRSNFPQSLVKGFTYDQIMGITSETDVDNRTTYYEYDSAGRLHQIKDDDGNILKTFTYQNQGQP